MRAGQFFQRFAVKGSRKHAVSEKKEKDRFFELSRGGILSFVFTYI
ncbi:MAG: hypothetical protein ACE5L7_05425 [Candidatus Aminicenantales bacterium]